MAELVGISERHEYQHKATKRSKFEYTFSKEQKCRIHAGIIVIKPVIKYPTSSNPPEEFVNRFVTMDETWAHHFTPESKQQSMQWRHSGSPPPKKAKPVPSAGKVMVSVFWDSEGVLLLDFLNKAQTITGNYYAKFRRGKLSRKIVYHQDNAPSLRSLQAMAAIYDSGFEILPHAPYSPDLAPFDFHLFPHLKKSLSGIHFRSDEEVIDVSLKTSFFLEGIKALEHRWKKCIDLKGDYVEK
ncbi:hypothetical protein LAZ67_9003230 [Cordylochernes scorpioides]|uniref:Mariner Mos1 transposase n=1 Tax=Cordylochernes scorpioides TaxID=51811 RepID=A0ABY6KUD8_9ARAC|nr:hypothetical protein LAZ67_9003230 [Cordylochernes scorpioides]